MVTRRNASLSTWLPPGLRIQMQPAGQWWDAIRVPRALAELVLAELGSDSGAVIEDPQGRIVYWFVPVHSAQGWEFPRIANIEVRGETTHIPVPGTQRTAGPHWRIPPRRDTYITDPGKLREALRAAVDSVLGPRETTS